MRISELWIYPVKSLGGISVASAKVLAKGLEYDRRWMITDETGRFISQRTYPELALLEVTLHAEHLEITHRIDQSKKISIPYQPESGQKIQTSVWDSDSIQAQIVSSSADAWFSQYLGIHAHFVFMPDNSQRPVDPRYGNQDDFVSFADGYPFMLISTASLADLNARLDEPVLMNRFRPNLVVEGSAAFEEDQWSSIQIGDIKFDVVKPCSRCVMITIDQETASKGTEPLKTLATYRKVSNKIMFGQNLIGRKVGTISVGDKLEILELK